KNNGGISYGRALHEQLMEDNDVMIPGELDLQIYHYGYLHHIVTEKGKVERNRRILQNGEQIDKESGYYFYNEAQQFRMEGNYEESLTYLIEACNRSHNDDGDWRKTCFVMLADTLMKLNRYEDSLAIIKDAEEVWSYIPDFPMLKAIIYFHQSRFDDTKDICYQVVDAMHMYTAPILIPSCKDAIPYELLGDIYMREQDYQNAITHYIHALGY